MDGGRSSWLDPPSLWSGQVLYRSVSKQRDSVQISRQRALSVYLIMKLQYSTVSFVVLMLPGPEKRPNLFIRPHASESENDAWLLRDSLVLGKLAGEQTCDDASTWLLGGWADSMECISLLAHWSICSMISPSGPSSSIFLLEI